MRIALYSTKSYDRKYFEKANEKHNHEIFYFEPSLDERTSKLMENIDAVCVFVNDKLDEATIEKLLEKNVKLITLRCAGFNNVDVKKAINSGLKILRVPAYSPYAVAEHAVALILTLNRKTHKAYNRVREHNFSLERLVGFDLYGKTVGIIGTGKIGEAFFRIMSGFGCKIVAYDKYPSETLIQKGLEYQELDKVFRESDILSLHCPLTPETQHIINSKSMDMMKDGMMLINTSRGGLVNTIDVIKALKSGKLGYLGIDVYEQEENLFFKDLSEKVIPDDTIARLMTFPNVLVTAHQAFFTDNALHEIANTTLRNVTDFAEGKIDGKNEVTLDMIQ